MTRLPLVYWLIVNAAVLTSLALGFAGVNWEDRTSLVYAPTVGVILLVGLIAEIRKP